MGYVPAPEKPLQPAVAYGAVVVAIADHEWFLKPPTETGTRLLVTGIDGAVTQWDMDPELAALVVRRLRGDYRIRHITMHPYDHAAERVA